MPLITDYGTLQTAVADWLYRAGDANFQANAPQFINNFEKSFARTHRLFEMEQLDTTVLQGPTVSMPPGYLEAIRLQLTGLAAGVPNQPLTYVTAQRSAALDATQQSSGVPKNFTYLANRIVISPQQWVPVGATLEVAFYQFVQLKDSQGGTNWLLQNHDDLYLFGSLMQGAAYVDDDEAVAKWQARRDEALDQLLAADKKKKVTGPLRMGASTNFRTRHFRRPGA